MFGRSPSWALPAIAVALAAASGLIFDALTPEIIWAGLFYVSVVFASFWFAQPKAALALGLFATPLIIIGYWISIPDGVSGWAAFLNRALAIVTVWLTAGFVWYIRVLDQELQANKDRLQLALDAAKLGWWRYDSSRHMASGDTRFKEIFWRCCG